MSKSRVLKLGKEMLCGWLAAAVAFQPVVYAQSVTTGSNQVVLIAPVAPLSNGTKLPANIKDPLVQIDTELSKALVEASYYGAPGIAVLPPSRQQLDTFDRNLQTARRALEVGISDFIATTSPADLQANLSRVTVIANIYFNLAMRIERVRAIIGEKVDPTTWDARFALNLPLKNSADYVFAESLAEVNANFGNSQINYFASIDLNNDRITLRPLVREALKMDENRLASDRSENAAITLAQYMTTLVLALNQLQLQYILGQPLTLNLPAKLTAKFPGLQHLPFVFLQGERLGNQKAIAEDMRKNLAEWLTEIHKSGHYLVSTPLLQDLQAGLGFTQFTSDAAAAALDKARVEGFEPLESVNGTLVANNLLGLMSYEQLSVPELQKNISAAIAESAAMVLRNEFLVNAQNSEGQPANEQQREVIKNHIQLARNQFADRLQTFLKVPAQNVFANLQKRRGDARLKIIDNIVTSGSKFNAIGKDENADVDSGALLAALKSQISNLKMSEIATERVKILSNSPNYANTRDIYFDFLIQHLSLFKNPKVDVPLNAATQIDVIQGKSWMTEAQFSDEIWSKAEAKYPEMKTLTQPVPEIFKKDGLAWLELGRLMGFDRFPLTTPKVKDLNLEKSVKNDYFDELRLRMLTEFPLFDQVINHDRGRDVTLIQQLGFGEQAKWSAIQQRPFVEFALKRMIESTQHNFSVIAGDEPSLWEKALLKTGLQSEKDPTLQFFLVLSSASALAGQIGMHPGMAGAYTKALAELGEANWATRAWSKIVSVNQQVMWTMIAWIAATMLMRFPARTVTNFFFRFQSTTIRSTVQAVSNSKAMTFVEKGLAKGSALLSSVESSVLAPAFGYQLNRLNNAILGIFVAHLTVSGIDAFYNQPRNRDGLVSFYTCSLSGPCLINARTMKQWNDEVSGLQTKWAVELGVMVLFIGAVWGLSHLLSKTLPTWRLDRLTKDMNRIQRDIGFQNGRNSFHPDDIADMGEATINTLSGKVHPAFNPNKDLPARTQSRVESVASKAGLDENQTAALIRKTQIDSANLAKAGMAARIRASVADLQFLVRQEELFWRKWEVQLRPHLNMFNNQGRFPLPQEMLKFLQDTAAKFKSGEISREQHVFMMDSYRKVENFVFPHYLRASTEPTYTALLARTFGVQQNAFLRSGDLNMIKAFGGGYMTIQSRGATVAKDRQLVELSARDSNIPYRADTQVATRFKRYKIENDAWWTYLRQFTDPKDFPMNTGGPQIAGPPSMRLIGQREIKLLEDFSGGAK